MSKLLLDLRVPDKYDKATMADIIRQLCTQVNQLSEGGITARYQADTTTPAGSAVAYVAGDMKWNKSPSELGSAGSKYVVLGWLNVTAGSPGTFVEVRALTGN